MQVDLAVQVTYFTNVYKPYKLTMYIMLVLSSTVSNGITAHFGDMAKETALFIENFDKFFDTLNVTNYTSSIRSLKPFKKPMKMTFV